MLVHTFRDLERMDIHYFFFCFARLQMPIIKSKLFLGQLTIFWMKSSTLAQYKNFEPVFVQSDGLEPDLFNLEDLDKFELGVYFFVFQVSGMFRSPLCTVTKLQ